MRLRRFALPVVSLAVAPVFAAGATQAERLAPGQRVERALARGEARAYDLALAEGHALDVRLIGVAVTLSLQNREGQDRLEGSRLLVVSDGEPLRLVVRALRRDARAARYVVELGSMRRASGQDRLRFQGALSLHAGRRHVAAQERASIFRAEREFADAKRLYEEAGDPAGESEASLLLADAQQGLANAQAALEMYGRARELAVAAADPLLESAALSALGLLQSRLGQMQPAFANLRGALQIARSHRDPTRQAQALLALATALAHREEGDEALALLEEALPLAVEQGDSLREASIHNTLGGIYVDLRDGERALHHVQATLRLRRQAGQRQPEAGALINLAIVTGGLLGRHAEALPPLEQALAISREVGSRNLEAGALTILGGTLVHLGRHREALLALERAQAIWRDLDDARGLTDVSAHLGDVFLKLGQKRQAREAFAAALSEARRSGRAQMEVIALLGLARTALAEADLPEALQRAEQGVSLIESARRSFTRSELRTTYFSVVRPAYELHIDLLMRKGEVAAAFSASERSRARTLLDALTAADPEAPALPAPPQAEAGDVQRQLDGESVLVEYALGEQRSYAFVVTREGLRAIALDGRKEIEDSSRRVVELMTARNRPARAGTAQLAQIAAADAAFPAAARELSDRVLRPLGLPEAQRLLIVADGALQYVPFAALPPPGSEEPLVTRRQVVMLPSASVLPELRRVSGAWSGAGKVVVLADPVFRPDDPRVAGAARVRSDAAQRVVLRSAEESGLGKLQRLVFSRAEADTIARLAAGKGRVFLDFAASRETVAASEVSGASIVHFATHGLLNSRNPELTGLVLSMVERNGAPRDGFLRLPDLHRLRLAADLVVLSACQTALGREIRGEGIVGLTRGFMLAGAPRVVASLWRVNDQATAELMKRFYTAMLSRGLPPAAALREAQLAMAADPRWKAPYYWAAFTLHGDWN